MTEPDATQMDDAVFQWFASAHPHEAYAQQPERFWELLHARYPTLKREDVEEVLAETARLPQRPRCIRCGRITPADATYPHGRCDDCEGEGLAEEWAQWHGEPFLYFERDND